MTYWMGKDREHIIQTEFKSLGKTEGAFSSNQPNQRELWDYEFGKALYDFVQLLLEVEVDENEI